MINTLLPLILQVVGFFVDKYVGDELAKKKAHANLLEFLKALEEGGVTSVRLRKSKERQEARLKSRLGEI
jgi:hypothetical protein